MENNITLYYKYKFSSKTKAWNGRQLYGHCSLVPQPFPSPSCCRSISICEAHSLHLPKSNPLSEQLLQQPQPHSYSCLFFNSTTQEFVPWLYCRSRKTRSPLLHISRQTQQTRSHQGSSSRPGWPAGYEQSNSDLNVHRSRCSVSKTSLTGPK